MLAFRIPLTSGLDLSIYYNQYSDRRTCERVCAYDGMNDMFNGNKYKYVDAPHRICMTHEMTESLHLPPVQCFSDTHTRKHHEICRQIIYNL